MPIDKRSFGTPRVSVLMTVYNGAMFLRESIDSILAQTFPDWELIAVDDGSTDASPLILADYSDSRVRVFPLAKNIGRTPALRYAFDNARGEYIAVLDQDDISHPARLERQVKYLEEHRDCVLVGSWAEHIDEEGQVFAWFSPPTDQNEIIDFLGYRNPFVHSSVMYQKEAALVVGGYPSEIVYAQDYGLILKLAQKGKIAIINEYLCKFRVLRGSMSNASRYRIDIQKDDIVLLNYARKTLPLSASACRLNRRSIAKKKIKYGMALVRKNILLGIKMILSGIAHDPTALWMNGKIFKVFGKYDGFVRRCPQSKIKKVLTKLLNSHYKP